MVTAFAFVMAAVAAWLERHEQPTRPVEGDDRWLEELSDAEVETLRKPPPTEGGDDGGPVGWWKYGTAQPTEGEDDGQR